MREFNTTKVSYISDLIGRFSIVLYCKINSYLTFQLIFLPFQRAPFYNFNLSTVVWKMLEEKCTSKPNMQSFVYFYYLYFMLYLFLLSFYFIYSKKIGH